MTCHVHFGDSNSAFYGPTGAPLHLNGTGSVNWPFLLAGRVGVKDLTINAVAGSFAIDQADPAFALAPQAANRHFYALGTNDQDYYGTDTNKRAGFDLTARAGIAALLSNKSVCGSAGWTLSSGWATNATNPATGLPYTQGKASNTAGATASVSFSGDELLIWYTLQPQASTIGFNVLNASGSPVFVSTNPPGDITTLPVASGGTGKGYGLGLKRLTGFGSGSHTAAFTVVNGPVYLAGIGSGRASFTTGGAYVLSIPRSGSYTSGSDANVIAYNQVLSDACSDLGATFIDAGSCVQISSMNGGPHYDNNGHHAMAEAVAGAL